MLIKSSKASVENRFVGFKDDALKAAMLILFTFSCCPAHPLVAAS